MYFPAKGLEWQLLELRQLRRHRFPLFSNSSGGNGSSYGHRCHCRRHHFVAGGSSEMGGCSGGWRRRRRLLLRRRQWRLLRSSSKWQRASRSCGRSCSRGTMGGRQLRRRWHCYSTGCSSSGGGSTCRSGGRHRQRRLLLRRPRRQHTAAAGGGAAAVGGNSACPTFSARPLSQHEQIWPERCCVASSDPVQLVSSACFQILFNR